MQDPFLRTLAAQAASADWIGIFAGEQVALHMRSVRLDGALSAVGEQWLQGCLPGLETCIETQCQATLYPTKRGIVTEYGFPQTAGYPIAVSVLHLSSELHSPEYAALSGTIRRWPSRLSSGSAGAGAWWQIIAGTQAGDWSSVSRVLTAILGAKGTAAIGTQFSNHRDTTTQPALTVLAAGNAQESCGLVSVVALPAIRVRADTLQINLG
jgi:hypothetical protein